MEILELPDHPFFFASQFHPEFKSRPTRPSPPFVAFVSACRDQRRHPEPAGNTTPVSDIQEPQVY